jgi:hypothetical protein
VLPILMARVDKGWPGLPRLQNLLQIGARPSGGEIEITVHIAEVTPVWDFSDIRVEIQTLCT